MDNVIFDKKEQAAAFIVDRLCSLLEEKPDAMICIAAGHTSLPIFEAMKEAQDEGRLDLEYAQFIGIGEWERILPSDPGSCANFMYTHLFFPLEVEPMHIHLFDSLGKSGECQVVREIIRMHGGIDFLVLGLGMNGHLGFNEPGSDPASTVRLVEISDKTREVFAKYFDGEVPQYPRAMTLGLREMFASKQIYLPVFGAEKAPVVKKLLDKEPTTDFPASYLKMCDWATLVLDNDSAKEL